MSRDERDTAHSARPRVAEWYLELVSVADLTQKIVVLLIACIRRTRATSDLQDSPAETASSADRYSPLDTGLSRHLGTVIRPPALSSEACWALSRRRNHCEKIVLER